MTEAAARQTQSGSDLSLNDETSTLQAVPQTTSRLGRLLSNLLSPPIVAFGAFWVLADRFAHGNRTQVFLFCALAQAVLPVAYLKWAVRRGWIGDVDMSRRTERRLGLPMLGVIYALGVVVAGAIDIPAGVLIVMIGSLIVLAGIWLINLSYKASGHVAGVTAYMTAISLLVQPMHWGLLLIPTLAWARVRVGAHTLAQTIWGGALGAAGTWAIYAFLYEPLMAARL